MITKYQSGPYNVTDDGGSSGGGVLVVNVTATEEVDEDIVRVCDKTAGEMWAAIENGGVLFKSAESGTVAYELLYSAYTMASGGYSFNNTFFADTASDYPKEEGQK